MIDLEMSMLEDVLDALLADVLSDRDPLHPDGFDRGVWDALAQAGYTEVGSFGLPGPHDLGHVMALARLVGRRAAPVPIVEATFLANWLLDEAALPRPSGVYTAAGGGPADDLVLEHAGGQWTLRGTVHDVPWATEAAAVVAAVPHGADDVRVVVLDPSSGQLETSTNLAGEPRSSMRLASVIIGGDRVSASVPVSLADVEHRRALSIAARAAGAAEEVARRSVTYARSRHQFGRPIAAFQAVQHLLVRCSSEAALLRTSVDAAATSFDDRDRRHLVAAMAKSLTDRCGSTVAAAAHQIHGAAGLTREQQLGSLTQRLWSWRAECGSSRRWNAEVATLAIEASEQESLWQLLVE